MSTAADAGIAQSNKGTAPTIVKKKEIHHILFF